MKRRRLTMVELRELILRDIAADETVTPNAIAVRNRLGSGINAYRVPLVMERLANDGLLEIRAGARHRDFRRKESTP